MFQIYYMIWSVAAKELDAFVLQLWALGQVPQEGGRPSCRRTCWCQEVVMVDGVGSGWLIACGLEVTRCSRRRSPVLVSALTCSAPR